MDRSRLAFGRGTAWRLDPLSRLWLSWSRHSGDDAALACIINLSTERGEDHVRNPPVFWMTASVVRGLVPPSSPPVRSTPCVSYSHSMIEAWWRILKHYWLYLHTLDSASPVEKLVAFHCVAKGVGGRDPEKCLRRSTDSRQQPDQCCVSPTSAASSASPWSDLLPRLRTVHACRSPRSE